MEQFVTTRVLEETSSKVRMWEEFVLDLIGWTDDCGCGLKKQILLFAVLFLGI